jgi:MoaA/NifB/PqqE/SkfB family radical SAM enzyme
MNDSFYLINPKKLQFELSSMCNALCLGCVRTDSNNFTDKKAVIPEKKYIEFDTFKKILATKSFETVTYLEFCGTIDDPLMHPQFLEFLDYASELNRSYHVIIHTNSSLRNQNYWKKLANILKKHKDHDVLFSLDGLEDTNHIYRQNTNWIKIMENAEAFIQEGGKASWQFIIFPWNEHQVEEAKQLSIRMGFKNFMSRHDRSIATQLGLEKINFIKKSNIVKKYNSTLEIINEELKNDVDNEISCNNRNKQMYFIGHDSRIWPCCFLHNGFFNLDSSKRDILQSRLFDVYGSNDWNDCSLHDIENILSHSFYTEDLLDSWKSKEHGLGKKDRIHRCTEVCNVKKLKELPIGTAKILYSEKNV